MRGRAPGRAGHRRCGRCRTRTGPRIRPAAGETISRALSTARTSAAGARQQAQQPEESPRKPGQHHEHPAGGHQPGVAQRPAGRAALLGALPQIGQRPGALPGQQHPAECAGGQCEHRPPTPIQEATSTNTTTSASAPSPIAIRSRDAAGGRSSGEPWPCAPPPPAGRGAASLPERLVRRRSRARPGTGRATRPGSRVGQPVPDPHTGDPCHASPTIEPLILLRPTVRSVKVIGTSTTRAPSRTARQAQSTWKQ